MESLSCWGVGLARTGNTSFCAALGLLGYERVRQDPRFEDLRDLQGGSGNSVVLHFKYLDYLFPGSKFVLTTRTVEGWLRSMERSQKHNPRPIAGEHERIARRMAIYDCVGYDEQTLAGAFHRHHAEIRRYFANRPNDLLELNVAGGQGWAKLCPFLGLPAPQVAFPALNQGFAV
jgi:hypothetical protein